MSRAARFPRATRTERRWLVLLTAAFICAGAAFAVVTPMFENPDEATHLDMARHYSRHPLDQAGPGLRQSQAVRGAFAATGLFDTPSELAMAGIPPSRPDYQPLDRYGGDEPATSCPVTCQNYQFIHPPSWYLSMAPVVWALDDRPFPEVVLVLRLVNVLLVSVLVWCAWRMARDLWPARPRRAFLAAALVACAGPLAATAAAVNNDGFMLPLSGIALVLLTRILLAGADVPRAVGLGTVVALGLLTKGQFVLVAVVGCVALVVAERREPRWWHALAAYLVVGGVGGLWWWRVFLDTHGFTPGGSELLAPPAPGPWEGASYPGYVLERLPDAFGRFPGWYGWKLAILPPWLLIPIQVAIVALAVLWVVCRRWQRPTREGLRLLVLAALPALLLMSSAYTAYDTYRENGDQHGLAPRYLYGMAPLFAVGVVGALAVIAPRLGVQRVLATAAVPLFAAMAAFGIGASFLVAQQAAYFTSSASTAFQRAGIVAPVGHPKAWLVVLVIAWVTLLALVVQAARLDRLTPASPRAHLNGS